MNITNIPTVRFLLFGQLLTGEAVPETAGERFL